MNWTIVDKIPTSEGASVVMASQPLDSDLPVVVGLHGLGSEGRWWTRIAEKLNANFITANIDPKDWGKVNNKEAIVTKMFPLSIRAEVAAGLVNSAIKLTNKPVHLVGHSLGSTTLAMLATDGLGRVRYINMNKISSFTFLAPPVFPDPSRLQAYFAERTTQMPHGRQRIRRNPQPGGTPNYTIIEPGFWESLNLYQPVEMAERVANICSEWAKPYTYVSMAFDNVLNPPGLSEESLEQTRQNYELLQDFIAGNMQIVVNEFGSLGHDFLQADELAGVVAHLENNIARGEQFRLR